VLPRITCAVGLLMRIVVHMRLNWALNTVWKDIRLPKCLCYVAHLSVDWKNSFVGPWWQICQRRSSSATLRPRLTIVLFKFPARDCLHVCRHLGKLCRKMSWRRSVLWHWKSLNFPSNLFSPVTFNYLERVTVIIISACLSPVWFGYKSYRYFRVSWKRVRINWT